NSPPEALASKLIKVIPSLKIELVSLRIVSTVLCYRLIARADQLHLELAHNCACNLVLNFENVLQLAIKGLSPQMIAVSRVDQLRRYAHPFASLAHTALQNLRHIQLLAYSADVLVLSLEREA